jgi:hypothetical protein
MKKKLFLITNIFLAFTISCTQSSNITSQVEAANTNSLSLNKSIIPSSAWTQGLLPITTNINQQIIANHLLKPLNITLGGNKIYKSNNPEVIKENGWLMQNSRKDATRGGKTFALKGTNIVYLFHINKSGSKKFIHLLVTNPNANAIQVSSKGSYYNNSEKPLNGAGAGQSFAVAKDWLNNTLRQPQTSATSIAQGKAKQIFSLPMNDSNMVDGRFEVTTSGDAFYYIVVTSTGNINDAILASQGNFAPGDYFKDIPNDFGRECGIFQNSEVNANNDLILPNTPSHLGFCLNTTNKFFPVEDQTSTALMNMSESNPKTYGNYGHKYNVKFNLKNNGTTNRTVKLYFASNALDVTDSGLTWNGPIKMNNSVFNISTKKNAPRQQLSTWTVEPGTFEVTLEFYVPGLITTNQQLIFESN